MKDKIVGMMLRKALSSWHEEVTENSNDCETYKYSTELVGMFIVFSYSVKSSVVHTLSITVNGTQVCACMYNPQSDKSFPPEFNLLKTVITIANPKSKALRHLPDSVKCIL